MFHVCICWLLTLKLPMTQISEQFVFYILFYFHVVFIIYTFYVTYFQNITFRYIFHVVFVTCTFSVTILWFSKRHISLHFSCCFHHMHIFRNISVIFKPSHFVIFFVLFHHVHIFCNSCTIFKTSHFAIFFVLFSSHAHFL